MLFVNRITLTNYTCFPAHHIHHDVSKQNILQMFHTSHLNPNIVSPPNCTIYIRCHSAQFHCNYTWGSSRELKFNRNNFCATMINNEIVFIFTYAAEESLLVVFFKKTNQYSRKIKMLIVPLQNLRGEQCYGVYLISLNAWCTFTFFIYS